MVSPTHVTITLIRYIVIQTHMHAHRQIHPQSHACIFPHMQIYPFYIETHTYIVSLMYTLNIYCFR